MAMTASGNAICVPGNHDDKLKRALAGANVSVAYGLAESLAQIEALPESEREAFNSDYLRFADELVSHYWLDGGKLCVAHAGMKESYIGRASSRSAPSRSTARRPGRPMSSACRSAVRGRRITAARRR